MASCLGRTTVIDTPTFDRSKSSPDLTSPLMDGRCKGQMAMPVVQRRDDDTESVRTRAYPEEKEAIDSPAKANLSILLQKSREMAEQVERQQELVRQEEAQAAAAARRFRPRSRSHSQGAAAARRKPSDGTKTASAPGTTTLTPQTLADHTAAAQEVPLARELWSSQHEPSAEELNLGKKESGRGRKKDDPEGHGASQPVLPEESPFRFGTATPAPSSTAEWYNIDCASLPAVSASETPVPSGSGASPPVPPLASDIPMSPQRSRRPGNRDLDSAPGAREREKAEHHRISTPERETSTTWRATLPSASREELIRTMNLHGLNDAERTLPMGPRSATESRNSSRLAAA